MINTAKKAFSILLTVCMLFAFIPTAMAEDTVTYSLEGDATIFAPPVGSFSKVEYKLIKTTTPDGGTATSEVVEGAELSISGTIPAGVSLNASKTALLLDGSKIKNGSFKVTATKGDETASKDVTVYDGRHYYDFEDIAVDSTKQFQLKGKKLSDGSYLGSINNSGGTSSSGVKEEIVGGNRYVNALGPTHPGYFMIKPEWGTSVITNSRYMTIEFDVKNPGSASVIMKENSKTAINLASTNNKLKIGTTETNFTFSSTEWTKIQVVMDFNTHKAIVIADGNRFDAIDMPTSLTYPNQFFWNCRAIDNIAFYTGAPVPATLTTDIISSVAVGSKDVKIPISSNGTISVDGGTISTDVKWSTASTGASISADNKYLEINSGTTEDITLTAVGSGVKKNYTIDVVSALETTPLDNKIGAAYLGGISKIEATFSGTNVVLKGIGSDITLEGEKENSKLHIYFDEITKEYIAICDAVTVANGTFTTLSDVVLEGATISRIYAGGIFHEAPMALDAKLLPTTPVVGQSMAVIYTYFSKLGYEKTGESVTWYLEDATPQTSINFAIDKEMVGKTLSAEVTVEGGGETSEASSTSTETIKDVYEVSLDGNKIVVKILSIEEEAENEGFIIGVEWLSGGQSVGTLAKAIDYDGDTYTITADTAIDDARVWLMYNDLSPLAGEKYASGAHISYTPSGKTQTEISYADGNLYVYDTSGAMTTVVIYKPVDDNDFAQSSSFPFGILEAENEVNLDDYISYMGVIAPDAKIPFDISKNNGLYKAEGITQTGKSLAEFIIGKEKLFTEDKLQTLTEAEFEKVMTLTGATADYDEYQKADPEAVNTLMQAEEYDMAELETAVLLSAFLEDKNNKEALITNLTARSLDISGIAIIIKNHNFAKSASLVDLDAGIENAIESIFETGILQGVANSGNYMETRDYLSSIGGYTVSDDMALAFTPSDENSHIYETLDALKAALDTYINNPSGDGGTNEGTDSGTDNSNDGFGGTTGNSGFVGGGGGGGGGGSQSTPKDDQPNSENQGTNSTSQTFSDVSANHWASSDISYLVENKIISGMGDGSFRPENSITRAEFLKILAVAFPITATEDTGQFEDVNKNDWYYQYVIKASEAGVVSGDGRNFRPNDAISRQDAAVMLYRVLANLNVELEEGESSATDSADISSYAVKAVNTLYGAGIINGMGDGTFMPKNNITRAQAAAIVARVLR